MEGANPELLAAFRQGLVANWTLIVLLAGLSAAHEFAACGGQDKQAIVRACTEDGRKSLLNAGFAFFGAAGSAFFGALPFDKVHLRDHLAFFFAWLFLALAYMTLQLATRRLTPGDSEGWTSARLAAMVGAAGFTYWIWHGALVNG